MKSYDVIIVGAGPAGAVAGFLCAGSGLKTLIIERKQLPRPKSCGGGVTAKAISLLKQINCFDATWFDPLVQEFIIHLPKSDNTYALAAKAPFMGIVRRNLFDMALIEKARAQGAELRTGESFHRFRQTARQTLEVATDQSVYKTRVLIGADGCQSRVRKQMADRFFGTPDRIPTLLGVEGDLAAEAVEGVSNKFCHLFFDFAPGVIYGWVFPRGRLSDYRHLCRRNILTDLNFSYLFHILFKAFPGAYNGLGYEQIRRLFLPYIRGELGYPQTFAKALAYGLGYKFGILRNKK